MSVAGGGVGNLEFANWWCLGLFRFSESLSDRFSVCVPSSRRDPGQVSGQLGELGWGMGSPESKEHNCLLASKCCPLQTQGCVHASEEQAIAGTPRGGSPALIQRGLGEPRAPTRCSSAALRARVPCEPESRASCDFISKTPAATWPRQQGKKRLLVGARQHRAPRGSETRAR